MRACKESGIAPANANSAFKTLERFRELEQDVARLRALRKAMGYVQNASESTVTLWQDDATNDFSIRVGKLELFDHSFSGALDKLIDYNKESE